MDTHYSLGTGEYRTTTPFSELRDILAEAKRAMQARGLEGEELSRGVRIYARTYRHFYEQNGGSKLDPKIEDELVQRVTSELALHTSIRHHSKALTGAEFTYGLHCTIRDVVPSSLSVGETPTSQTLSTLLHFGITR